MGFLAGLKSRLSGKPTLEQFEKKTIGLPPAEAAPKWVEFAKEHEELKPDDAMYGYRRAAALYREIGDMKAFVQQSLNYAKAAERVPEYAIAGDGFRVAAEYEKEGSEQNYARAADNYRKAGEKAEADRHTTLASDMYAAAADCYERAKDYQKAIENHLKSTAISERKKHLIRVARDYGKVAENYLRLKDYEKSAEFFLKHAEAETSRANVAYSDGYYRAGATYVKAGKLDKAAEAYLKHAEFSNEPAYGYRNAAQCYQKLGDPEKALEYYLKAVDDDLAKGRTFVAAEVLKLARTIAKDKSKIDAKLQEIRVPAGFEKASLEFRKTLGRELQRKGLPALT